MLLKIYIITVLYMLLHQSEVDCKINKHVICYHGTWSTYRSSYGKFDVSNIDPFLCTHLMYAFFGIEESGDLRIIDPYLDLEDNYGRGNIKKFNALKLKNPTLKTLAAVGGWNEGSKNFSIVAGDANKRARFVKSVVSFLQRHGFDGLDLDWEYPLQRHNLTTQDDRNNYITLLRELKEGLDPFNYLLTAAVGSAEFSASLSYNIPEVSKYLDIISVMAYDLHGPWDDVIGINAPLYGGNSDKTKREKQLNVDAIIKYWLSKGAPSDKLVLGIPFYGRSFTLENAEKHTPGSPHLGRGIAGQYSVEPGVIGYNELCEKMQSERWHEEWESEQMVPYAYQGRQWVGYENLNSIKLKADYVMEKNLAGIMIWSIESDDFRGQCGEEKFPLLKQVNKILFGLTATGMTEATSKIQNLSTTDANKDNKGISGTDGSSTFIFKCEGQNGYVRSQYDCSKFYYCDPNDNSFSFECPHGLYFDLESISCNYADQVKC
ncbi:chitinase-3-like protein 1 [Teleopsis dalmanni]|uniref:chitinase-3-like protein 1 n=1 Tax=Teleopsis dalmanni TaxID=139649 RepID=UPI0018CE86BD|nr:chitinase-3-like protein 1 [Teleopsis dalmanni]XP_037951349.1 chitinase-3-like protein 1 [Teleopsis dalmanni]